MRTPLFLTECVVHPSPPVFLPVPRLHHSSPPSVRWPACLPAHASPPSRLRHSPSPPVFSAPPPAKRGGGWEGGKPPAGNVQRRTWMTIPPPHPSPVNGGGSVFPPAGRGCRTPSPAHASPPSACIIPPSLAFSPLPLRSGGRLGGGQQTRLRSPTGGPLDSHATQAAFRAAGPQACPAATASARRGNNGRNPRSSRRRRPSSTAAKARARSGSLPSGGDWPTAANSAARSGASSSVTL